MICKVNCIHNIDGACFTYSFKPHIGDLCLCMDSGQRFFEDRDVGLNEIVVCERKDCIHIFKTKYNEERGGQTAYCFIDNLILTNTNGKMECNKYQRS